MTRYWMKGKQAASKVASKLQKKAVPDEKQSPAVRSMQTRNSKENPGDKGKKTVPDRNEDKPALKTFKGHVVTDLDAEEEDYEDSDFDDIVDSESGSDRASDESEIEDEPALSLLDRFAEEGDDSEDEEDSESNDESDVDDDAESDSSVDESTQMVEANENSDDEEDDENELLAENSEDDDEDELNSEDESAGISGKTLLKKFGDDDSDEEDTDMGTIIKHNTESGTKSSRKRKLSPELPEKKTSGSDVQTDTSAQKDDRDRRTLFIKDFAASTSRQDLMALSSDITAVRMRTRGRFGQNRFAFVEFGSEEAAQKYYKQLAATKQLNGQKVMVKYIGDNKPSAKNHKESETESNRKRKLSPSPTKSPEKKQKTSNDDVPTNASVQKEIQVLEGKYRDTRDRRTLFVSNLPLSTTIEDVQALYKDMQFVSLRKMTNKALSACIVLQSEEVAEKCHKLLLSEKNMGSRKMFVKRMGNKRATDKTQCYLCGGKGHSGRHCSSREWRENQLSVKDVGLDFNQQTIQDMFPGASDFEFPQPWSPADRTALRSLNVTFKTFEDAKAAYLANQEKEYSVNFSFKPAARKKKEHRRQTLKSKQNRNRRSAARKRREKLKNRVLGHA